MQTVDCETTGENQIHTKAANAYVPVFTAEAKKSLQSLGMSIFARTRSASNKKGEGFQRALGVIKKYRAIDSNAFLEPIETFEDLKLAVRTYLPKPRRAKKKALEPAKACHRKSDYRQYINSYEWTARRKLFFAFLSSLGVSIEHCERCASKCNPEVHHLHYENLGQEKDEDLQALCKSCHLADHRHRPYASFGSKLAFCRWITTMGREFAAKRYPRQFSC